MYIFITHVPKFPFVVLFVHASDGIDRYVFRVLVWQRRNTYFFNIVRMAIVRVATCWTSLTMVTCKRIKLVKLTVTVFIYHKTETLRNEFSNRSTVSLVGKAVVSRAGLFRGKPLWKWPTLVRNFVAPLKFVITLKESSLLLTYMRPHWQFSKTTKTYLLSNKWCPLYCG